MRASSLPTDVTLGEKIRYWREKRGLDAKDLAEKATLSQSYISLLESDSRINPTKRTINKLANALNVSPQILLDNQQFSIVKLAPHLSPEDEALILNEKIVPFMRINRKAMEMGIPADVIENILDTIINTIKNRNS